MAAKGCDLAMLASEFGHEREVLKFVGGAGRDRTDE